MRSIIGMLGLVSLISACTTQVNAANEGEWASLTYEGGKDLFVEKCGMCHRAAGMGTGILARRMDADLALLENRQNLSPEYVSVIVRNGFNTMFPITRSEVSDPQLAAIAGYLAKEEQE